MYEYLTKFTGDPLVQETLQFLMTREIAHLQMFQAALSTVQPNFPPGVLQGDPRFTHLFFDMSNGVSARGPWNEGQGPWNSGEWTYIDDPLEHVVATQGLTKQKSTSPHSREELDRKNREISKMRSSEVNKATPNGEQHWSEYRERNSGSPRRKAS